MMLSQQRVMSILNKSNDGDRISHGCDMFLSILIVLNLIAVCLESVESFNSLYRTPLIIFEAISVTIFLVEYCLRIWSVAADEDNKSATASGRRFG